jgi:hypothetical protein
MNVNSHCIKMALFEFEGFRVLSQTEFETSIRPAGRGLPFIGVGGIVVDTETGKIKDRSVGIRDSVAVMNNRIPRNNERVTFTHCRCSLFSGNFD